ncbi:MAG: ribbon-helix-helix domain-containing protein [Bacteroidetes bacterium]|nr:ribbon-helix-helix domain-containing protein [Bacteroidota bacterium]
MPTRAHIFLPEELVKEVDRVAGKRKRSRFVELAIRERLAREALSMALKESAGVLSPADYPEWETPEKTSNWVRSMRQEDDKHLERKLSAKGE